MLQPEPVRRLGAGIEIDGHNPMALGISAGQRDSCGYLFAFVERIASPGRDKNYRDPRLLLGKSELAVPVVSELECPAVQERHGTFLEEIGELLGSLPVGTGIRDEEVIPPSVSHVHHQVYSSSLRTSNPRKNDAIGSRHPDDIAR